jgi:predicted nucleotidyltransferase
MLGKNGERAVDIDGLVDIVCRTEPQAKAVILVGSWARGEANAGSDVDLVVLWAKPYRALQVGAFADRLVELVYIPIPPPSEQPRRATLFGARILYDPDGLAEAWLSRFRSVWEEGPMSSPALAAYRRWDAEQGLRTLEWLASRGADAEAALVSRHLVEDLLLELFERHGRWPPSLHRQLTELEGIDAASAAMLRRCLTATQAGDIHQACRLAVQSLWGSLTLPAVQEAPILPLD